MTNSGLNALTTYLQPNPLRRNRNIGTRICNQEEKYVAVLLIPLDGTFKNRQNSIPVVIQKIEEQSDASDLMQRWENGPDYISLESPDEQEKLATYLKDREAEGVNRCTFISQMTWVRVRRQLITWSLTLRDFQVE
jgi:hypothetical protein